MKPQVSQNWMLRLFQMGLINIQHQDMADQIQKQIVMGCYPETLSSNIVNMMEVQHQI